MAKDFFFAAVLSTRPPVSLFLSGRKRSRDFGKMANLKNCGYYLRLPRLTHSTLPHERRCPTYHPPPPPPPPPPHPDFNFGRMARDLCPTIVAEFSLQVHLRVMRRSPRRFSGSFYGLPIVPPRQDFPLFGSRVPFCTFCGTTCARTLV